MAPHPDYAQLTARELEVLKLIGDGCPTKQIAHLLHISFKTVASHKSHIMDKLGVHDLSGLVRYAIRSGVSSSDKSPWS
jgi:DNA-binding NarL/FixJ family response regulator